VALALVAAALAAAELPPPLQAALLKKVFLFDSALGDGSRLVVVYTDTAEEAAAERLVAAFRAVALPAEAVRADLAAERVPEVGVVYFLGADADEGLRRLCVEHRRLSVGGVAALAESGRVAVAVGVAAGGTPEIVVHRRRLEEEGHRLEPRLLKVARMVG
jgi:hypothetical protein